MADDLAGLTHTNGAKLDGAVIEAETAVDVVQGESGIAEIIASAQDPQGLVVGQINDPYDVGVGLSFGDTVTGDGFETEWRASAGVSLGFDGPDAGIEGRFTHNRDLGDGHSFEVLGQGQYTVQEGFDGQLSADRSWVNPEDEFGIQSWSTGAGIGTLGSDDSLCGAVRGEVYYGGEMNQVFTRGALGTCGNGAEYSLEAGYSRDVTSNLPGMVQGALGENRVHLEGGVRVGDAGAINRNSLGHDVEGVTPFVGVQMKF